MNKLTPIEQAMALMLGIVPTAAECEPSDGFAGSIADRSSEAVNIGVDYATGEDYSVVVYNDGVECDHVGCRHHITHPCECCGRIGAHGKAYVRLSKQ